MFVPVTTQGGAGDNSLKAAAVSPKGKTGGQETKGQNRSYSKPPPKSWVRKMRAAAGGIERGGLGFSQTPYLLWVVWGKQEKKKQSGDPCKTLWQATG